MGGRSGDVDAGHGAGDGAVWKGCGAREEDREVVGAGPGVLATVFWGGIVADGGEVKGEVEASGGETDVHIGEECVGSQLLGRQRRGEREREWG